MVFKSTDNGSTWTSTTVENFPDALENYTGATGESYTYEDIGLIDSLPIPTDSLAIASNDGFGAVLVDPVTEMVHVWYPRLFVTDADFATAGTNVYLGSNGILYWREDLGSPAFITGALDYNGDTTINIPQAETLGAQRYGNATLASMPTVGATADGTLYLAYSAINELFTTGGSPDLVYRHLYVMKSLDGGTTWGDPYELTTATYVTEIDLLPITEAVYPVLPRRVQDDAVWIIYQADYQPGVALWGAAHDATTNQIQFVSVDPDSISAGAVSAHEPRVDFRVRLSPNPASSFVRIDADRDAAGPARVELTDLFGRLIRRSSLPAGITTATLPVQDLAPGAYLVRITDQKGRFGIGKMVKQ
jgi:hypothetical protein